jgi:hypothetical protein
MDQPTFKELIDQLNGVRSQLKTAGISEDEAIDLEIMSLHIERQIELSAFEPLQAVAAVAVPDFTKLRAYSEELKTAIENEKRRGELIGKILASAKNILHLSGIPIPLP